MKQPNNAKIIAKNLGDLLNAKRLTKSAFSTEIGISRQHLDDLLSADANPRLDALEKISNYFDIPLWKLLAPALGDAVVRNSSAEAPSRMLERIASEATKLRESVGKIPGDVLDLLSGFAANNPEDPIFIAIREMAGATDVTEEAESARASQKKK